MESLPPPVILAVILIGSLWVAMKFSMGFVLALGLMRMPARPSAFVRFIADVVDEEAPGNGRKIRYALACALIIGVCNASLLLLLPSVHSEPAERDLVLVFIAAEALWFVWLWRFVARNRPGSR